MTPSASPGCHGHPDNPSEKDTVESIRRIFNARSVAVVGASANPVKYGRMTLDCLLEGGYDGTIYPVNPRGGEIRGLKAYPSVGAIPGRLDLVVIIVPFQFVEGILEQAAEKGAAGAVICSGGFKDAGRPDLEEKLKQIGKKTGVRLLGPNISGMAYLPNKMCAQFFPALTMAGPLAVVCQSGTVTNGLCEWACDDGLGVAAGINLGNQADLCESDYLNYFAQDPNVKSIVMYIEGASHGRRLFETLRRTAARKPVVVYKGGRTEAGKRSTASHTGSMASSHQVFSAACRQAGALFAHDIQTAYDFAKALALMRPPRGNRLLAVSSSGGANTLAMDEIDAHDLTVPELPAEAREKLGTLGISPLADFRNPIDLVSIRADDFRKAVLAVDEMDLADMVLLNFGDPVDGDLELVQELDRKVGASLAVCYYGGGARERTGRPALGRAGFPVFSAPERAVRGMGGVVWRENYLKRRALT